MSDSDSDSSGGVEESPFDDYGGPDNSQLGAVTKDNNSGVRSVPLPLGQIPSQDSQESLSKVSGGDVGDLPESTLFLQDSVKNQMSKKFADLMTDMQEDDDEMR